MDDIITQVRGSIPLFWTQEHAQRRLKPAIALQRFDPLYESTRLHFQVMPQPATGDLEMQGLDTSHHFSQELKPCLGCELARSNAFTIYLL